MSSLRKLEHDRTRAELASLEALLDQLHDEDMMMRLGLEARRDELIAAIQHFDEQEETTASAALFFGGRPVAGSRGIESEFWGKCRHKISGLSCQAPSARSRRIGAAGRCPEQRCRHTPHNECSPWFLRLPPRGD
jgi:hypothetical protein